MGAIFGFVKFIVGAVLGAATGATIATLIVTRDGGETIGRLRGVFEDMVAGARVAAQEEEIRMNTRFTELVGQEARQRELKAAEERARKKAEKDKDKKKK